MTSEVTKRNWTEDEINYLKENYSSLTFKQIAEKLNRQEKQVGKKALSLGLKRREYTNQWSKDEDIIIKEHFQYAPKNKIMKLLPNRTWSAITQRGWLTFNLHRETQDRYDIDYKFFETWTPESAYIFGFIASDGYLKIDNGDNNENSLQFELADYDRDILDKIKASLKYEGPIGISKRNTVKLTINSRKICMDLVNLGIPAKNKTFDIKWPETLPRELESHFVRGLFDGDGSIYLKNNLPTIQFLGTENLVEAIKNSIPVKVIASVYDRNRQNCNVFSLQITRSAMDIFEWLYKDATIYLERKYKKYQQFVDLKPRSIIGAF